ncbi:chemotaxis protein [uncultured Desulfovibrio sp.]|uniref:chemotaxis protein n=1 Tax=uncultured Desulfovibrio sp. TaxID=167968 RepID=UPI0025FDEFA5|nr:chemotaxis protein [uncultured Desulfovibrio sp.]
MRTTNASLRRRHRLLSGLGAVLLALALGACGPREIGTGSSEESMASGGGAPTAEMMRYPMTGSGARERMLYLSNRPDVMQRVQDWNLQGYQRRMGVQPSPEDPAYRAVPKQRSPFRQ